MIGKYTIHESYKLNIYLHLVNVGIWFIFMVNVGNHTCYGNGTNFFGGNQSMQIYPWSSSSLGYLELVALRQANIGYDRLDPRWTKCKGNWKMWVLYQLVISQDPWDWHTFNIRINHSCTDIFMVHGPFYGKMRLWEPIFCAMKFRALKCHALGGVSAYVLGGFFTEGVSIKKSMFFYIFFTPVIKFHPFCYGLFPIFSDSSFAPKNNKMKKNTDFLVFHWNWDVSLASEKTIPTISDFDQISWKETSI